MATWAHAAYGGFVSKSVSDASSTVTVSGKSSRKSSRSASPSPDADDLAWCSSCKNSYRSSRSASPSPGQNTMFFAADADDLAWCSPRKDSMQNQLPARSGSYSRCPSSDDRGSDPKDSMQNQLPARSGSYSRCQSPDDYYFDPKGDILFEPSPMSSRCVRSSGAPPAPVLRLLPELWPHGEVSKTPPSHNDFNNAEGSQAWNIVNNAGTTALQSTQGETSSGVERQKRWTRGNRAGVKKTRGRKPRNQASLSDAHHEATAVGQSSGPAAKTDPGAQHAQFEAEQP